MLSFCAILMWLGVTMSASAPQQLEFVEPKSSFITVRLGLSIILDCQTTDASANVTLWKLKKGKEMNIQPSFDVIQSSQVFTIHNIDLEDAGKYRCKAQDSMGTIITKDVHVIINTLKPSLVLRPDKAFETLAGLTVTFTCQAIGGSISWKHIPNGKSNNRKPPKYTVKTTTNSSITHSVLTITNAQVTDSGTYECWLYYYGSSSYRNAFLLVKNSKRPSFTNGHSSPELNVVKLGHSMHLDCRVNGYPPPVIFWEKNGNPISTCRKIFLHYCQGLYLLKNHGLQIRSARFPDDNATFTCVAKNSVGVSRKDFHVVVEVQPKLDKSESLLMKKPSYVTCHALEGNPPPKFIWSMQLFYFSGKRPNEKRWSPISKFRNEATVSSDGMTSTIKIPRTISRAFYRCVAVNSVGQDTHTIKVIRY